LPEQEGQKTLVRREDVEADERKPLENSDKVSS